MIIYKEGDVYLTEDVNIIFNPVGVRDKTGFIERVKILHPVVYEEYHERVWMYSINEILADIQIVCINNNQCMFNAFCKDKEGKVNKLALCKTLIELCNLCHEYNLSVGIERSLGVRDKYEKKWIDIIIEEIFKDSDTDIYIYKRKRTKHNRKGKKPRP